jgi:lysosomal Pro-X carboxypeptidase
MMLLLQIAIFLLYSQYSLAEYKYSSADCKWRYVEQPLAHFNRGSVERTYKQRICVYDGFWKPNAQLPIFLYTGNESPVEEYVNNTGLLWTLAEKKSALVVFAEHRYFGESIPDLKSIPNCVSYLSVSEVLFDLFIISWILMIV